MEWEPTAVELADQEHDDSQPEPRAAVPPRHSSITKPSSRHFPTGGDADLIKGRRVFATVAVAACELACRACA
eukprot:7958410-Pyramimonas_sp.AAC.4